METAILFAQKIHSKLGVAWKKVAIARRNRDRDFGKVSERQITVPDFPTLAIPPSRYIGVVVQWRSSNFSPHLYAYLPSGVREGTGAVLTESNTDPAFIGNGSLTGALQDGFYPRAQRFAPAGAEFESVLVVPKVRGKAIPYYSGYYDFFLDFPGDTLFAGEAQVRIWAGGKLLVTDTSAGDCDGVDEDGNGSRNWWYIGYLVNPPPPNGPIQMYNQCNDYVPYATQP